MLRDHGQAKKYYHDIEGYNGRLDAVQAGILSVKLRHLPEWTASRRAAAARYRELFTDAGMAEMAPFEPEWVRAVYHLYVIRVPERDGLMRQLAEMGIGTGIHYPVPLHLQKAYDCLGYAPDNFPIAERVAVEIVSLPIFPGIQAEALSRVADAMHVSSTR
jgi:dTDP-4-amino-4,6-dideoxygalactose transaminase